MSSLCKVAQYSYIQKYIFEMLIKVSGYRELTCALPITSIQNGCCQLTDVLLCNSAIVHLEGRLLKSCPNTGKGEVCKDLKGGGGLTHYHHAILGNASSTVKG
jgi:hypothetical protein